MILPDRLGPDLRVVFCGTAAGAVSARKGHYYAGPGNLFWPLLHEVGFTPRRLAPEDDHLALSFGLGLTDLAKTASGADADIPPEAWDASALFAKLAFCKPQMLAFTSLTAARLALGRKNACPGPMAPDPRLPAVALWALPSPSGRARGHFDPKPWHDLASAAKMR